MIFLKCLRDSIWNHKVVSVLLFLFVGLATWVVLAVQLSDCLKRSCDYTQATCDSINAILLNLSYSFLAAYIFYIITVWLPDFLRSYKMFTVIEHEKKNIKIAIANMYSMFHSIDIGGHIDMNDIASICDRMGKNDWMEVLFAPLPGKNKMQHFAYFSKHLNDEILDFLTLYKDVLSTEDIKGLCEVLNANEVTLFEVLSNSNITKDNCKVIIDEYRKLLEAAKAYFKDLNS